MTALTGKQIVITRAPGQAPVFARLLRERGAEPLLYPCIDIAPPADPAPLDAALHEAARGAFDWLVLTSSNSAQAVASRLSEFGLRLPAVLRVAAVGTATAEAARQLLGVQASLIPETYTAQALAGALLPAAGKRFLLPKSALAGDALAQTLLDAGALVTVVSAYETVLGSGGVDLPALLAAGAVDAITFTSPSTVNNLLARLDVTRGDAAIVGRVCIACIGTTTARAARAAGFTVNVTAAEHTLPGLTRALEHYFEAIPSGTESDAEGQPDKYPAPNP